MNSSGPPRAADRAFTELGHVDGVVDNAGYGLCGAAEELADAQITHVLDTNLVGSIQVARAALPHLRAQRGGRIVQIWTPSPRRSSRSGPR